MERQEKFPENCETVEIILFNSRLKLLLNLQFELPGVLFGILMTLKGLFTDFTSRFHRTVSRSRIQFLLRFSIPVAAMIDFKVVIGIKMY